jgi:DNA-directed RNA polymerase specialized sigma24 family protein
MHPTARHPLVHPQVVDAIRATLRRHRMLRRDLDDGVAEVQTRALEYLRGKPEPGDVAGWAALCATIAAHWCLDEHERKKTARKYDVGLCGDADERIGLDAPPPARELVDVKRMDAVMQEELASPDAPEHAADILDAVAVGTPHAEIAEELGISVKEVRARLIRLRRHLRARLVALGLAALLSVVAVSGMKREAPDRNGVAPKQNGAAPDRNGVSEAA